MANARQERIQNIDNIPQNLYDYLVEDLKIVEDLLLEMDAEVLPMMDVMMHHVMAAGGKRTRSLLTIATAKLFGDITPTAHALAASIELIHTATLLHDDVMDGADLRRHNATAHTRFGNVMSILFGDFLLAMSFQRMLVKNDPKVMQIVAKACAAMAKGEMRQLTTRHQWQLSQAMYEQTISEKTASLFSAACQMGGLAHNVSAEVAQNLHLLGEHIGMAFQIIDDIMDYTQANTGKNPGSDFFDGKITLPVILAVKQGVKVEFWRSVFEREERDQTAFAAAAACLQQHGILDQCRAIAMERINQALDVLKLLPGDKAVSLHLKDFIHSLGGRLR